MEIKCKNCASSNIVKKGSQASGKQRLLCIDCGKRQQKEYTYSSYLVKDTEIVKLLKENVGIRSLGRILNISSTTVINRILKIAKPLKFKGVIAFGENYQVDELFTSIGNKKTKVCIAYSYNPKTKDVLSLSVGRRNKKNLRKVISTLILGNAKKITTDKLNIYKEIIPKSIHSTKFRGINHIERNNLELRKNLKRLNRRTMCFSKSISMLLACVKIYFWG